MFRTCYKFLKRLICLIRVKIKLYKCHVSNHLAYLLLLPCIWKLRSTTTLNIHSIWFRRVWDPVFVCICIYHYKQTVKDDRDQIETIQSMFILVAYAAWFCHIVMLGSVGLLCVCFLFVPVPKNLLAQGCLIFNQIGVFKLNSDVCVRNCICFGHLFHLYNPLHCKLLR